MRRNMDYMVDPAEAMANVLFSSIRNNAMGGRPTSLHLISFDEKNPEVDMYLQAELTKEGWFLRTVENAEPGDFSMVSVFPRKKSIRSNASNKALKKAVDAFVTWYLVGE